MCDDSVISETHLKVDYVNEEGSKHQTSIGKVKLRVEPSTAGRFIDNWKRKKIDEPYIDNQALFKFAEVYEPDRYIKCTVSIDTKGMSSAVRSELLSELRALYSMHPRMGSQPDILDVVTTITDVLPDLHDNVESSDV